MKVSLYVKDEVWEKFRRAVLRRRGDARSLSSEVQKLIEDAMVEDALAAGFRKIEVVPMPLSSFQVVAVKPSGETSAEDVLGEMRGGRHAKAVSR
ncbi:MAG: hypothetical protein JRN58_10325 [Nitrososphaerota archaeon]|nr:hypothetical protein [Nitrososphaerota archaeon]